MSNIHLEFKLQKSGYLAIYLLSIHAICLCIAWVFAYSTLMLPLISFSLIYYLRHHVLLVSKNSITHFIFTKTGDWLLKTHAGNVLEASLQGNSLHTKNLILLVFTIKNRYFIRAIPILIDSLDQHQLRPLHKLLFSQCTNECSTDP